MTTSHKSAGGGSSLGSDEHTGNLATFPGGARPSLGRAPFDDEQREELGECAEALLRARLASECAAAYVDQMEGTELPHHEMRCLFEMVQEQVLIAEAHLGRLQDEAA